MNVNFLRMLNNDEDLYPTKLEQEYPHIFSKLIELWESNQLKPYLDQIIFDARGNRLGFNDDIGNELWKLHFHRLKTESIIKDSDKKDYWDWIT